MANIGIEILGVIISQIAKQNAEKFKSLSSSAKGKSTDVEKHDDADSDTKPLLSSPADVKSTQGQSEKPQDNSNDDYSSKFDAFGDELDGELNSTLPKFSGPKS